MSVQPSVAPWSLALTCALLALLGLSSVLAKLVFPVARRRWESHVALQVILALAAALLALPVGASAKLAGAAAITLVVAGGGLLVLLRGREAGCDCFGAMTPKGPAVHVALLMSALALDAMLVLQIGYANHPVVRWMTPVGALIFVFGFYLWLAFHRYQGAFYRPERSVGRLPESLASDRVLGTTLAGESRTVGQLIHGAPVLVVVVLSSSCAGCYELLEHLSSRARKIGDAFPVAVIADHARMFQRVGEGLTTLVDPQVAVARYMLAQKLPVGFAINDAFELLAPPSASNAGILNLLSMIDSIRTDDVATVS